MESQKFYRTFYDFKWRKPFFIWASLFFGPIVIVGIYSLFTPYWLPWVGIFFVGGLLLWTTYQFLKRHEKKVSRWKTFVITIDEEAIHRDFDNDPTKTILRSQIRKVEKLRTRGIRINGDENFGIWVPSDTIGYEKIVEIIESDLKKSQGNVNAKIVDEPKPESFVSFIKLLQDNFGGISLFTTVIIILSYVKLFFNFALYGVNVNSYIDVSEIILSITPVIAELVIISLFFAGLYKLFEFVQIKNTQPLSGIQEVLSHIQMGCVLLASGTLYYHVPNLVIIKLPFDGIYFQVVILMGISVLVSFVAFTVHLHTLRIKSSARLVTMTSTSIGLLVTFLFIILEESRMSYALNKSGRPKYEVSLELTNDTRVSSSDSLIYVGSTSNYYFFHNFKTERNEIIPKSSVLKETQKQLRMGL